MEAGRCRDADRRPELRPAQERPGGLQGLDHVPAGAGGEYRHSGHRDQPPFQRGLSRSPVDDDTGRGSNHRHGDCSPDTANRDIQDRA